MKTVDELLTYLESYAIIAPPATDDDIHKLNIALPTGYASFLKKLNGFAWNGLEFYGTAPFAMGAGFLLIDIVSANENMHGWNENLPHVLFLGRVDDDAHVYNRLNGKYEVLDIVCWDVMEEYASFEEMFIDLVWRWIDTDEELLDTEVEHE